MPKRKSSALQVRAFGPDQPPLTDAEYAALQHLHGAAHNNDASAATPRPTHRRNPRWLAIAGTIIAVAGAAGGIGYTLGNAGQSKPSEPTDLSNGIQLADGQFRSFADATCTPILSVEDATLAGVNCTWADGVSASLGLNGDVSSSNSPLTQDTPTWRVP